jgi:hypothetical protein
MKRRRPWAGHSYPLWVPLRACRVNRRTGTSRNAMQSPRGSGPIVKNITKMTNENWIVT